MIGKNRSHWAGLFASLVWLSAGTIHAQDAVLAELYGQGVHAYFASDYTSAHEMFTSAIEQGSRDPRTYYFRGLAYTMLGRPDESTADFKKGAELEVASADRVYPIANSLQRVQGPQRLKIEKQRQRARLATASKAVKVQAARYEDLKRAEGNVLRNAGTAPAAAPASDPAKPVGEDKTDPFTADTTAKPEPAPEKPAEPAAPAADPAAPAAADPFGGTAPATPAPMAEAPAADATNNPFGDDKPAAPPAADAPAAPTAPAAPKPADPNDPFGE